MQKGKFLGRGKREYVNPRTGETGHELTLQLLLPDGVKIVKITDHVYAALAGVTQGDEVQVTFGFEEARFGGHYPVVASVHALGGAAR